MRPLSCTPLLSVLLLFSLCLSQASCTPRSAAVRHPQLQEVAHPALPGDLFLLRSVPAKTATSAHGEGACVSISDRQGLAGAFRQRLEQHLTERHFKIRPQPSRADRIITLKILYRGPGSREQMERIVRAGYDAPLPAIQGQDSILLADLLLVRRRVPEQKPQLTNVSAHNTLSSNTIRIGVHSGGQGALKGRALEEALAADIAGLAASDEDAQVHRPSSLTPLKKGSVRTKKASVSKKKSSVTKTKASVSKKKSSVKKRKASVSKKKASVKKKKGTKKRKTSKKT